MFLKSDQLNFYIRKKLSKTSKGKKSTLDKQLIDTKSRNKGKKAKKKQFANFWS